MSEKQKLAIISGVVGRGYKVGGEHLFYCPKCNHHKKKLSINIEKDKFKCWVCNYRGNSIRKLIRSHGNYVNLREWNKLTNFDREDIQSFESLMKEKLLGKNREEEVKLMNLPKEFISLTSTKLPVTARQPMSYLKNRGLTKQDIVRWKIGYCSSGDYANRIIIPSFADSGGVNYFVARSYNGGRKYQNPPSSKDMIFNELYIDWDDDLVLVEGVFDAVKAGNAVPILGNQISDKSKLFTEIVKHDTLVYVALDADAERKAMDLIKQLMEYGVELYKIDLGSYSDVGEMDHETFERKKDEATLMTSDSFVKHAIGMI